MAEKTSRHPFEERLKSLGETNRMLRTVFLSSPLAIIVLDTHHSVRMWNPAAETIFGWKAGEVIGKPLPTVPPEEAELAEFKKMAEEVKEGQPTLIRRTRRRRKDGQIIDVSISSAPLQGVGGRVIGIIGIIVDITEHKQAEDLYKTLADSSYAGVYVVQDGKFQFINRNAAAYGDYTVKELAGVESVSIIHPEDREIARLNATLMLKGRRQSPYEFRILTKGGQTRWLVETVTPINYNGKRAILGNSMDITERRRVDEALRESEERYRTILDNIEDLYYEVDLAGNFVFFNDACESLFGYKKEDMIGMNHREVEDPETAKKVYQQFNRVYTTGIPEKGLDWEIIKKDGTRGHVESSVRLIRNALGEPVGFRGIMRDITARKKTEQAVAYLAYHDVLTGLPNRILLNDRLSMAIAHSQRKRNRFALLFLDLDQFKNINDTYGHSTGDLLLRDVGERLSGILRKADTVARMGGDEFMVLLVDMELAEHSSKIAQKILAAFQTPFILDQRELRVTTSIGIAVYPDDGADRDTLMKNADVALYRAKREGRNQYRRFV